LLARSQRSQQIGGDRDAGIATSRFAGLDLRVDDFSFIDLKFGATGKIESERQLDKCDRRVGVARHANIDQYD
jgi:hypothetical protein